MRFNPWLAAGIAMAVIGSAAQAQNDPKALFSARYGELRTAMAAGDTSGIAQLVTPDYSMTDIRGESHDAAGLAVLAQRMQGGSDRKIESEVLKVALTGAQAAVEHKTSTSLTRSGPDGQPHQLQMIVVSDDSWVQVNNTWLLRTSVQKDLTVLRDGAEFFHQAN